MADTLQIPFLECKDGAAIGEISAMLDSLPRTPIAHAPWAEFPYVPEASFTTVWTNGFLIIKYYVKEEEATATYKNSNDPVYEDSCVEFFVSAEGGYYNFEFNCEGVCLAGFGAGKTDRTPLPESSIRQIQVQSEIIHSLNGDDYWELCVQIPFELFSADKPSLLREGFKANFYKCGDNLPTPHFLCWSNIDTPVPNFHVPEFFGQAYFQQN
ncbi:MAG: hypothetical protein K0S09_1839 [Sphingobacteriaceae bacterium]|jgi:hypothetical protein|nr:hypothetical protein [Sphingobacteriaceae bacterium]